MARPLNIRTYIDKDGIEHKRQKCSISGCNRSQQLIPLKRFDNLPKRYVGLSTCASHNKKGETFRCNDPDKRREQIWRAQKIPMTYPEYEALMARQNGRCALCGRTESDVGDGRHLCVDHDHKTGVVRGILCRGCNSHVAWLENHVSLETLNDYLMGIVK